MPIPGTKKVNRLEENLSAAAIEFTPQELSDIEKHLDSIKILGHRYSDFAESQIDK